MRAVSNTSPHSNLAIVGRLHLLFTGDLPAIRPTIDLLETKAGFRIAPALREKVLQATGE